MVLCGWTANDLLCPFHETAKNLSIFLLHIQEAWETVVQYSNVLALFTFILVSIAILALTLWSALDPLFTIISRHFDSTRHPPQYLVCVTCLSRTVEVWLSIILYGVNGVVVLAVIVFATLTRKVHLDCLKDTKQVNAFVLLTILCLGTWPPLLHIHTLNAESRNAVASYIVSIYPYFVQSVTLCSKDLVSKAQKM